MPEINNGKETKKVLNTGIDKSIDNLNKVDKAKETIGIFNDIRNAKSDEKGRRKFDGDLDNSGSGSLQKIDVPKGNTDKAIKKKNSKFSLGNSPAQNFIKNNSENAIAKKLNDNNGNPNNLGRKALNNIGNISSPRDNNPQKNKNAEAIKKITEIAKKIPVRHIQEAAKVTDAINKSGITNKVMSKNKDNNSTDSFKIFGSFSKQKIIFIGIAALVVIIIFSSIFFGFSNSSSAANAGSVNEGICVVDSDNGENNEECEEKSEESKNFHNMIKTVNSEFSANGKSFNSLYIAGFYFAVSSFNGSDIDYSSMTKDKIEEIANAMFKENGTTFDENTFKKNLKEKILPNYFSANSNVNYDDVIAKIFEYVDNFQSIYGSNDSFDSSCISSNLTANQLCSLHNSGNLDGWINQFGSVAQQDYSRTGVFASITIAQAILESGWGCSDIQNNLFGIKCSGYATCVNTGTHEYVNGQYISVNDSFRAYNNIAESISDHSKFLLDNVRYTQHGVFSAKNYQEQAYALKAAGYATSETYAQSLISVIEDYNLDKWDTTVNTSSSASCDGTGTSVSGWDLRTVAPAASDKAFNYKNSNRGQCVWYAQARAIEIVQNLVSKNKLSDEQEKKIRETLLGIYGDAGVWVEQSAGKFKTSNNIKDLKAGSIISWKQAGSYGHVAVIEDVTDKNVTITEGWATNTGSCPNDWGCINFKSRTISLDDFYSSFGKYYNGKGYSFNGYIYFLELA